MKTHQLLFLLAIAVCTFSCSGGNKDETKTSIPLSEQRLKFEIYDSLVVNYLGNLSLMDISPDGNSFLLIDTNTDSLFVTNTEGEIKYQYLKSGEGPGNYLGDRYGKAVFLNNQEFILPSSGGLIRYGIDGEYKNKYEAEFKSLPNLIIPNSDKLWIKGNKAYTYYFGRGIDEWGAQGITFQEKSTQLEEIDLESGDFRGIIPFPKESKFSSNELAYRNFFFHPVIALGPDSLYLSFKNEPKIFAYSLDDFSNPKSIKTIPLINFLENKPDGKEVSEGFNLEDLFKGSINSVSVTEDQEFLIDYLNGLSDEQYEKAMEEAGGNMNEIWPIASKLNSGGYILFDGKIVSPVIEKPEILGNLNKFISKEEIWFALNFSEAENDYSVIYKTRIVEK